MPNKRDEYHAFGIKWSPHPSAFHLKLLIKLIRPKIINPIVNCHNLHTQIPGFLKELCKNYAASRAPKSM